MGVMAMRMRLRQRLATVAVVADSMAASRSRGLTLVPAHPARIHRRLPVGEVPPVCAGAGDSSPGATLL